AVFEIADRARPRRRRGERPLRIGEERRACLRQPHAVPHAVKERRAQLLLERFDPAGEGRLRDRERLRGAGHVPRARHLDEALYLREQHVRIVTIGAADRGHPNFRWDRVSSGRACLWLTSFGCAVPWSCPTTLGPGTP